MADDKEGRENQARAENRRQRERAVQEELERWDETEPTVEEAELDELERELEAVSFPATGRDVVDAVGSREVASAGETYAVADLIPDSDGEVYEEPRAVRLHVHRPTVAGAIKRVVEAAEGLRDESLSGSRRTAYEKTFRALAAVEADDEDEGIRVVADWILEQVDEDESLPSSRAVRRRAAEFCRANGYEVRKDEWLGI